jgi:predicted nuclease of predicted toxin-antitoxin system
MPPQVKAHEDPPEAVARLFTAAGYPAETVRDQGWSGLQDDALWERVQAAQRWLVTADKGFGDVRMYVPGTYVGIILMRATIESRRRYVELAQATVRSARLEDVAGCLVVVTPRGRGTTGGCPSRTPVHFARSDQRLRLCR